MGPGFSTCSDIQKADAINNHDPFDPWRADPNAYQLFPLIYSGGASSDPGLKIEDKYHYGDATPVGDMFSNSVFREIGTPEGGATSYGGITNHHIEAR